MAWGILNDPKYPNVPGTTNLDDKAAKNDDQDEDPKELKKRGDIVLLPQPTDSPNDPLNWSNSRKYVIVFLLSLTAGVTVSLGPMITTGIDAVEEDFNVTSDQASFSLVGLLQLTTGGGTFFSAAAAAVWGKRPVFLISTFVLFATSSWGFFATNFTSLTIMRVIQGFSASPLETLVSATISEIFFVHERGKMLSVWNIFVMGGVKLGQLIAGFIIEVLGVKFTFGICAVIYAAIIPFMYFFVMETLYFPKEPETTVIYEKGSFWVVESLPDEEPKSYSEQLRIFQGRISQASFWKLAIKPLPLTLFPVVIYSALTYSLYAAGLTLIALLQDSIFGSAPYNLDSSSIGLTNLPLFGVGLVGSLTAGWCADFVVRFMSNHNNKLYEPEFRLILMSVATLLVTGAYVGLAFSISAGASIYIIVAFLGVQTLGVPFATSATFTYVMDCHPTHAPQAFVTMNFIKALIGLGMSDFINGWYQSSGPKQVFLIVALANVAISALSIPMYIFGKRLRSKVARNNFYQKF